MKTTTPPNANDIRRAAVVLDDGARWTHDDDERRSLERVIVWLTNEWLSPQRFNQWYEERGRAS